MARDGILSTNLTFAPIPTAMRHVFFAFGILIADYADDRIHVEQNSRRVSICFSYTVIHIDHIHTRHAVVNDVVHLQYC
jgi:hypothetical protein